MSSQGKPPRHIWGMYAVGLVMLLLGILWLNQYLGYGFISSSNGPLDGFKTGWTIFGVYACLAVLAPLVGGIITLGGAIWISFKRRKL